MQSLGWTLTRTRSPQAPRAPGWRRPPSCALMRCQVRGQSPMWEPPANANPATLVPAARTHVPRTSLKSKIFLMSSTCFFHVPPPPVSPFSRAMSLLYRLESDCRGAARERRMRREKCLRGDGRRRFKRRGESRWSALRCSRTMWASCRLPRPAASLLYGNWTTQSWTKHGGASACSCQNKSLSNKRYYISTKSYL